MIDLNEYKKLLEKNNISNLSESEVVKLQEQQDQMAEVFFSMWIEEINKAKVQV